MSWRKINAFCIDGTEKWAFAGNVSGQIQTIDIQKFCISHEVQAHSGTLVALAAHPFLPFIAALGMERAVSIWQYDEEGRLTRLFEIPTRELKCDNDQQRYIAIQSESQAICFHPTERRVATRSGNGGLLEFSFDDKGYEILRCTRVDPEWDMVTLRYVGVSHQILVGTVRGGVLLVDEGKVIREWKFFEEQIHWFEPYTENTYLIASDSRRLIRLDLSEKEPPLIGEPFAKDDFEHVCYNQVSGKVYASSFDRNLYEIDPDSCRAARVVFRGAFKFRWMETLQTKPSFLIAQCRNGALYHIDVDNPENYRVIKETPDALWSGVTTSTGKIIVAGEGKYFLEFSPYDVTTPHRRLTGFNVRKIPLGTDFPAYTKRVAIHPRTGCLAFGRTNGEILIGKGETTKCLIALGSAVRDLQFHSTKDILYVACEDGRVLKITLPSGEILACFQSDTYPVWSLALNEKKGVLAASERMGKLFFLEADTLDILFSEEQNRFSKRMKWVDENRLLYGNGSDVYRYDLRTKTTQALVTLIGNTIEDFVWDPAQKYLIFINYKRDVLVSDFETGEILSRVPDQIDYSKGLCFLDPHVNKSGHPYEFLTFGRTGVPHLFQIHDEKVMSCGFVEVPC